MPNGAEIVAPRRPAPELVASYLAFLEDVARLGKQVWPARPLPGNSPEKFVEMLRQVLQTPTAKTIGRLLLTCAPSTVASNRTILANGGVLERTSFVERIARETNLYWIEL